MSNINWFNGFIETENNVVVILVVNILSCLSGAGAAGDQQQTLPCVLLCRSNITVFIFCASLLCVHFISSKSGAGAEDVYHPKWKYYQILSFLRDP